MNQIEIEPARVKSEDIAWRHFWLKSVLVDAGKTMPLHRPRPPAPRLSLSQRIRKLHHLRAVLDE